MDPQLKAKKLVAMYNNDFPENDNLPAMRANDFFVVWFSKTLQNWKALVGSNHPELEGLYFEVTHNGTRSETYIDVYLKIANVKVKDRDFNAKVAGK